jgi:hypothetical protein
MIIVNTACASPAPVYEFTEVRHSRDEILPRVFDALSSNTDRAQYLIESEGVTESQANDVVASVEKDLEKIENFFGEKSLPKLNIIVSKYGENGKPLEEAYQKNRAVIMPAVSAQSFEYYASLVSACSECEPWIAYGVSGILSGTKADNRRIAEYFESRDNLNILGLSGLRFYECVGGEEEVNKAKEVSVSLVRYIDDKYGRDELIKLAGKKSGLDLAEVKRNWLKSIGVKRGYEYPYEGQFADFEFTSSKNYDVIASCGSFTFNIKWLGDKEDELNSADSAESFLVKSVNQAELARTFLEENTDNPDKLNTDARVRVFIDEDIHRYHDSGGYAETETDSIYLYNDLGTWAFMHELVHIYTGSMTYNGKFVKWLSEGVCEYVSAIRFDGYHMDEWMGFTDCNMRYADLKSIYEKTYPYLASLDPVWTDRLLGYYLSHGGSLDSSEEFDTALFYDSCAYSNLQMYRDSGNSAGMLIPEFGYDPIGSYVFATSFTNWLAEQYSFTDVLDAALDYSSFETTFGKDFMTLQEEWRNSILKEEP